MAAKPKRKTVRPKEGIKQGCVWTQCGRFIDHLERDEEKRMRDPYDDEGPKTSSSVYELRYGDLPSVHTTHCIVNAGKTSNP